MILPFPQHILPHLCGIRFVEDLRKSARSKPAKLLSEGQRKMWRTGIALDAKYFLKCEQSIRERNLGSLKPEFKKKKKKENDS